MNTVTVLYKIKVDTLEGFIKYQESTENKFSEEQIWQIIQNVTLGLKMLDEYNLTHRNINVRVIY